MLTSTVVQHGLSASLAYFSRFPSTLPASCSIQCNTAEHGLVNMFSSSCTPLSCASSRGLALGCRCQG